MKIAKLTVKKTDLIVENVPFIVKLISLLEMILKASPTKTEDIPKVTNVRSHPGRK